MCASTREDGSVITANDPHWDMLTERAKAARHRATEWLEMPQIYGDLAAHPRFASTFAAWLSAIYDDGVKMTVQKYLDQS